MPPSDLFVDRVTREIDFDRVVAEAIPIATLIGVFVTLVLVPLAIVFLVGSNSIVGLLFTLLALFVLAVGAGVVLLYVIVRGIRLADDR